MILTDAQRMAATFGDDISKAGLGRASIRKNLWPGAVLVYQLDPAIGKKQNYIILLSWCDCSVLQIIIMMVITLSEELILNHKSQG